MGLGGDGGDGVEDADTITESNLRRNPLHSGGHGLWWWVVTKTKPTVSYPDGQTILRGAYSTEEQAENEGERIGREYQTVQLATRETGKATQMWREKRLQRGHDLEKAMERQRHHGQEFGD